MVIIMIIINLFIGIKIYKIHMHKKFFNQILIRQIIFFYNKIF